MNVDCGFFIFDGRALASGLHHINNPQSTIRNRFPLGAFFPCWVLWVVETVQGERAELGIGGAWGLQAGDFVCVIVRSIHASGALK
jgi:hypothetical protein